MVGSGGMARIHAHAGAGLGPAAAGRRARARGSDFRAPAQPWVEALRGRSDVGAVVIATPHTTHLPLVRAAAAAGKHVFLAKPMGLDVAECDAMIAACRSAGVRLMG